MASRVGRRIIFFSVVLFFVVGFLFIEQRPKHDVPNMLLNQIHDMVSGPGADKDQKLPNKEEATTPEVLDPCTAQSPLRGFIDLRGLSSSVNDGKAVVWQARGFEGNRNYSVGICLTPVKRTQLNVPVKDELNASEVGAFYLDSKSGEIVLMGQLSTTPVFHGQKLTLTYSDGSYCDTVKYANGERIRRKTIVTFTCDHNMMSKAHLSSVAAVDDCTYLFEMRSHFACPTSAKADNLAALWIFVLIFLAALLVYCSGGFFYRHLKRQTVIGAPPV